MKQNLTFKMLCVSSLIIFTGCQTTGDPNEGGLFGWSESKALKRQTVLEKRSGDFQSQVDKERGLTDDYLRQQQGLHKEISAQETRLNRLVDENQKLEKQLTMLHQKNSVQSKTLENLRDELSTLQQEIDLYADNSVYGTTESRKVYLQNIERANQKYKEAILFLLKY